MGKIKDQFDAELWTTSGALKIGIKRTRHINTTTVAFFTDSKVAKTKILEPRIRTGGGGTRDLIY